MRPYCCSHPLAILFLEGFELLILLPFQVARWVEVKKRKNWSPITPGHSSPGYSSSPSLVPIIRILRNSLPLPTVEIQLGNRMMQRSHCLHGCLFLVISFIKFFHYFIHITVPCTLPYPTSFHLLFFFFFSFFVLLHRFKYHRYHCSRSANLYSTNSYQGIPWYELLYKYNIFA